MQIHQITQISESHCGAAVLQMLLETLGVTTSQEEITRMAEVEEVIEEHGMRVDQIALASNRIAPQLTFWYKYYSSLEDIQYLLNHNIPIGVEWQGLFYDSVEQEIAEGGSDNEHGHYSVIAFFDDESEQLVIVDPYKDFVNQSRIFSAETFLNRWWDTNEIRDEHTGKVTLVKDVQLLFFVTPDDVQLPPEMGFKRFNMVQNGSRFHH